MSGMPDNGNKEGITREGEKREMRPGRKLTRFAERRKERQMRAVAAEEGGSVKIEGKVPP